MRLSQIARTHECQIVNSRSDSLANSRGCEFARIQLASRVAVRSRGRRLAAESIYVYVRRSVARRKTALRGDTAAECRRVGIDHDDVGRA